MNDNLFRLGNFTLASGLKADWKIECDALTNDDWKTVAKIIAANRKFGSVVGVPTGGLKLASYLEPFCLEDSKVCLIVDDVYTTGKSINETLQTVLKTTDQYYGIVLFARKPIKDNWVEAIFTYWDVDNTERP